MQPTKALLVGLCLFGLSSVGAWAQRQFIPPAYAPTRAANGVYNLRVSKPTANGTEVILTADYTYDGTAGPRAYIIPVFEKRGARGVAAWFGANPTLITPGKGLISVKCRYFNDEPGVPPQITTDRVMFWILNETRGLVLSQDPFANKINWGNPSAKPVPLPAAPTLGPGAEAAAPATLKRLAEEQAKTEAEVRARTAAEAKAKAEAAAREKARLEAAARAQKLEAEKRLAEEKARQETAARRKAEEQRSADEKARIEAEAKAKAEAKAREEARQQAAAEAKARAEAEAKAKVEADAREKARLAAEAEAKRLAEEKRQAEQQQLADAQAKAEADAREKARLAAEAEAKRLTEEKRLADEKARVEEQARQRAEAKRLAEEKVRQEAEAKAKAEADAREKARLAAEADAKARAEAEAKAQAEADAREKARLAAEAEERRLAEEKQLADAKAAAEAKALEQARNRAATEEQARQAAEAQAKAEAEAKGRDQARQKTAAETVATPAAAAAPVEIPLASNLKTKISNVDVVNRSLDRSEMTIGVEFDYKDRLGPKAMLGVDVLQSSDPNTAQYFESTPAELGRSRRNFALFPVKFQPPPNSPTAQRGSLATDRILVYLTEAERAAKENLYPATMLLTWRVPGSTAPVPPVAADGSTLALDTFRQNDLHTGFAKVNYNLSAPAATLRARVFDSANPTSAEFFEAQEQAIKSGRGSALIEIDVKPDAKTTDPLIKADTLQIDMIDDSGKPIARIMEKTPMRWAKPKR